MGFPVPLPFLSCSFADILRAHFFFLAYREEAFSPAPNGRTGHVPSSCLLPFFPFTLGPAFPFLHFHVPTKLKPPCGHFHSLLFTSSGHYILIFSFLRGGRCDVDSSSPETLFSGASPSLFSLPTDRGLPSFLLINRIIPMGGAYFSLVADLFTLPPSPP